MKKTLIVSVVMALGLTLISAGAQAAYSPKAGDLVKAKNSQAVYVIGEDGRRHLFPTEDTFWSWNTGTWRTNPVITLSETDFSALNAGRNVTMRPGTYLIKFGASDIVYVAVEGNELCYAESGFGTAWTKRFRRVPMAFEFDYDKLQRCTITSEKQLPDGTLIQYKGSKDIYVIVNHEKRKLTPGGMTANKYKTEFVVTGVEPTLSYNSGSDISSYNPDLGLLRSLEQ